MTPNHPLLFSPFDLRGLTLRNRVVVSPMCQYQAVDGAVGDWHYAHHARFALGGVGTAIVEATAVTAEGRITPGCTGLWSDAHIPGLKQITDLYRAQGVVPAIQLGHAGRRASCQRPWDGGLPLAAGGKEAPWPFVGPSPLPERDGAPVPRELTISDIDALVESFRSAFRRALKAGFDIVEIHGAHGYLIHSFFSPLSNLRSDAYGGSLGNRMRFALRIAETAREIWPKDRPVFYRASVVDGIEGGVTLEDTVALARELKARGVDVIDCSSGGMAGSVTLSGKKIRPGFQVPLSSGVKRGADIATMAVGAILTGPQAEQILAEGNADLIAIGREFLADPNWCLHAAEALGVENAYQLLPKYYSFYLERRAAVLER